MKATLIVFLMLLVLATLWFFVQGFLSRSGSAAGLDGGRLASCPDKPNCVCSEYRGDKVAYVPPVDLSAASRAMVWPIVKQTLVEMGGAVQQEQDDYLAVIFKSGLFGFVDDLEVRFDNSTQRLHIRSASRVGHSDFGVNRKRVAKFKAVLASKLSGDEIIR